MKLPSLDNIVVQDYCVCLGRITTVTTLGIDNFCTIIMVSWATIEGK